MLNQNNIPLLNSHPIFNWHLEVSSKCTLHCPRCPRTEQLGKYKVTEHSIEFVQKILTTDILQHCTKIVLCGSQGDPIYCRDFLKIVEYIKTTNPNICMQITTNGSYKDTVWWQQLAGLLNSNDLVTFSIDGWDQDSNNLYRVNSDYQSAVNGLKTLRAYNSDVVIVWSTIVFSFNQNKLDVICSQARDYGADKFNIVESFLFGTNILSYVDPELGYDPLEPSNVSKWNYHEISAVKLTNRVHPKTHANLMAVQADAVVNEYEDAPIVPLCKVGERGIYVNAEGILYPCCWTSQPFQILKSRVNNKEILWDENIFAKHKDKFDLNNYSLEEILSGPYWAKITESWTNESKSFVECDNKCNKKSSMNRINSKLTPSLISYDSFLEIYKSKIT